MCGRLWTGTAGVSAGGGGVGAVGVVVVVRLGVKSGLGLSVMACSWFCGGGNSDAFGGWVRFVQS